MSINEYNIDLIQKGQWLLHHVRKDGNPFNRCIYTEISNLTIDSIRKAIIDLISINECFRTSFILSKGILKHRVHSLESLNMDEILKSNCWDQGKGEIDLKAIYDSEIKKPFDLNKCPLLRINFWFHSASSYLFFTIHHTIYDAESFPILYKQMFSLYEKHSSKLNEKTKMSQIQYKDYFIWKIDNMEKVRTEAREFWRQNFKRVTKPDSIDINNSCITDLEDKAEMFEDEDLQLLSKVLPFNDFEGSVYRFYISQELTTKIENLQSKHGCSVYTILLTCFSVLLYHIYNRSSNIISFTVSDRGYFKHRDTIGWLVSSAAFLGEVNGDSSLKNVLEYSINEFFRSLKHRFYPIDKVLEDNQFLLPYNEVIPIYLNFFVLPEEKNDTTWKYIPDLKKRIRYDLHYHISKYENAIEIECVFNEAIFSILEISKFAKKYLTIVRFLLENSNRNVKSLF